MNFLPSEFVAAGKFCPDVLNVFHFLSVEFVPGFLLPISFRGISFHFGTGIFLLVKFDAENFLLYGNYVSFFAASTIIYPTEIDPRKL